MSYDIVKEDVPSYLRRVGDHVIQGSNNSGIVFGSDRASPGLSKFDSGLGHTGASGGGKGAGSVYVFAGLKDKQGNPNFKDDSSYLYLSMKSDPDKVMGTSKEGNQTSIPSALLKTDAARIVVRKDIKIAFDDGRSYIHLNSDSCTIKIEDSAFMKMTKDKIIIDGNIELGEGATEKLVKGNAFMTLFNSHTHVCVTGPGAPPVPQMIPTTHLSQRTVSVK